MHAVKDMKFLLAVHRTGAIKKKNVTRFVWHKPHDEWSKLKIHSINVEIMRLVIVRQIVQHYVFKTKRLIIFALLGDWINLSGLENISQRTPWVQIECAMLDSSVAAHSVADRTVVVVNSNGFFFVFSSKRH